jgi:hypothetical protein
MPRRDRKGADDPGSRRRRGSDEAVCVRIAYPGRGALEVPAGSMDGSFVAKVSPSDDVVSIGEETEGTAERVLSWSASPQGPGAGRHNHVTPAQ